MKASGWKVPAAEETWGIEELLAGMAEVAATWEWNIFSLLVAYSSMMSLISGRK